MYYTAKIADIESALIALGGEAPVRTIQLKVQELFCGNQVPSNYKSQRTFFQTIQRIIEDYCPQAQRYDPNRFDARLIRIDWGFYRHANYVGLGEAPISEEVTGSEELYEGATRKIAVNAYERNETARRHAIAHYGLFCQVCGFDFERVYGELGKAFIHVHHVKPLSEIGAEYEVDPIADLRPVCANCHAMIHRTKPAISIERLKNIMKSQQ